MKKRNFSKTGLILVGSMLVCVILVLAVGVPNGFFCDGGKGGDLDDDNTPGIKDVIETGTPLLIFDKSNDAQMLMEAFDEGKIASVEVLYDQEGANFPYKTKNKDEIKEVYKTLKNIMVVGEATGTVTDSYHYVSFEFEDGYVKSAYGSDLATESGAKNSYGYSFEGEGVLRLGNKAYDISGGNEFWEFLRDKCVGE